MQDWTKIKYDEPAWMREDYKPGPPPLSDAQALLWILSIPAGLVLAVALFLSDWVH